jgi:hypothetical protein
MNTSSKKNNALDMTPDSVAQLLTLATQRMDHKTLDALRRARNTALDKQLLPEPVFTLSTGHNLRWLIPHTPNQWIGTVLLVVIMFYGGITYIQQETDNEIGHLDAAILSDDMPLEVFIDKP